jgi:glycosyltransferase involved in cell wall biosynthesis
MKLVGIAVVKNEADIIEPFVRHNLAFLDSLIITDDSSSDETLLILRRLQNEGLSIHFHSPPENPVFIQSQITRTLVRLAAEHHQADWIFPLDADELIACAGEKLILPDPAESPPLAMLWKTYCAHPQDNPAETNPALRITHCMADESPATKVIIPKTLAKNPGLTIFEGNHLVGLDQKPVPAHPVSEWRLAHFYLRSFAHFAAKIAGRRSRYLTEANESFWLGQQYAPLYEKLCSDPAALEKTWNRHGPVVHDPFPYRGGELKYTRPQSDLARFLADFLPQSAQMARRLASAQPASPLEPSNACLQILQPGGRVAAEQTVPLTPVEPISVHFDFACPVEASSWTLRIKTLPCFLSIQSLHLFFEGLPDPVVQQNEKVMESLRPAAGSIETLYLSGCYFLASTHPSVLVPVPSHPGARLRGISLQLKMESDYLSLHDLSIVGPLVFSQQKTGEMRRRLEEMDRKYRRWKRSFLGRLGYALYRTRLFFRSTGKQNPFAGSPIPPS